jgi:hypothetical protein
MAQTQAVEHAGVHNITNKCAGLAGNLLGLDDLDPDCLHIRRWGKTSDVIGTKLRFRKNDIIFRTPSRLPA